MGFVLLSMIFWVEGNVHWFGLIGIVPILTAAIGWCTGSVVLGINTVKKP